MASEDYLIDRELGHGGFGSALLVKRIADNQQFVMKVVSLSRLAKMVDDETSKPDELLKIAQREADLMGSVAHPNIVRIFESFTKGDEFSLILEYCDSGTLRDAIKARKNALFPEEQIRSWMCQLALTLKYLHDRKILHRDVKSENVFLTCNGRVIKLGDFGISKSIDRTGQSAYTGVGTVAYSAPEYCEGRGYTHKSEVWAFGVVIYELATLHLPFRVKESAGNFMLLFVKICKTDPDPIAGSYSEELKELVCEKLLCKDPQLRPSMANVVLNPCISETLAGLSALGASLGTDTSDDISNEVRTLVVSDLASEEVTSENSLENQEAQDETMADEQVAKDIDLVMQSRIVDDLYKNDICKAMKDHKLTLRMLHEISDQELAEMFPQIGPRKAVKKFIDPKKRKYYKHQRHHEKKFFKVADQPKWMSVGEMTRTFIKGEKMSAKQAVAAAGSVLNMAFAGINGAFKRQVSGDFITYSPYSSWSEHQPKKPCDIFSYAVAILSTPPGMTIVCSRGEIVSLRLSEDASELPRMEWQVRLTLPEKHILSYAAVNLHAEEFYVTIMGEPHNSEIYTVNKKEITHIASRFLQISRNDVKIPLKPLISTALGGSRNFVGLSFDNETQTLFACAPLQGEITLWNLNFREITEPSLIGVINCRSLNYGIHPYCCTFYRSTNSSETLLAVCDTIENAVNLFACSKPIYTGNDFYFANCIAKVNLNNPAENGCVFGPSDIFFDSLGNLIVADSENERFQVFAILKNENGNKQYHSRFIWASKQLKSRVNRVAVVTRSGADQAATQTSMALVAVSSTSESSILCFQ